MTETVTVETLENGVVRVTHSRLPARPLKPDTIAVWNLWEEDSGYYFNNISAAASAGDHFYLCDMGNRQIVCVDLNGKVLFSFGRTGQGPGELQFPFNLNVFGEEIWVADMQNGRFSVFGLDGSYRNDHRWDGYQWFSGGFQLTGSSRILSAARTFEGFEETEDISPQYYARIIALDSGEADTLASMPGLPNQQISVSSVTGQKMIFIGPPKFAPRLHWASAGGGRFLTVTSLEYRFEQRDLQGRVHREIIAPAPDLMVTLKDKKWFFDEEGMRFGFGSGEVYTATRESLEEYPFADRRQAIEAIGIDPTGKTWVQAVTEDPGITRMDLFSSDGTYLGDLGNIPMPISFTKEGFALLQISDRESMDIFYVLDITIPATEL